VRITEDTVIAFIVGFFGGFIVTAALTVWLDPKGQIRSEAVRAGAAKYECDLNGNPVFTWKKQESR